MRVDTVKRFCFHKIGPMGASDTTLIRMKVRELAYLIDNICPESREKATALTQLSFVMMAANSAIVQSYPVDQSDLNEKEKECVNGQV